MRISRALLGLAASLAVLAPLSDAAACDCVPLEEALPSSLTPKVPVNTKVWVVSAGCNTLELRKSDGTVVPTTRSNISNMLVLNPEMPLEIGTSYTVDGCFSPDVPLTTFTVNEAEDNEAPPVPTFSTANYESGSGDFSSCGDYEYVPLIVDHTEKVLVMDVAASTTLDPATLSGKVTDMFFPDQNPNVGNAACGPNNWSFEDSGEAKDTRLATFDLAGNFSGWSGAQTIDAGCGCEVAGGGAGTSRLYVLAGVGLAALALRRRRRAALRLLSPSDPG